MPDLVQKAISVMRASVKHVKSGNKLVSFDQYMLRLATCQTCEVRQDYTCGKCGCSLTKKASWATQDCPLSKWVKLE